VRITLNPTLTILHLPKKSDTSQKTLAVFTVFFLCLRPDKNKMDIQQRIVEEATRQFFQYGIRNVTMDRIAAVLGMSKRTVYEMFKDKNELVHECLKSIKQKNNAKNQEIVTTSTNVIETIFSFMQKGIKAMNAINPVFFRDMEKFHNSTWKKLKEENEKEGFMLTNELLKKGIKEGLFREDINIQIVSKLFHEQMNLLANEEIFPRDEFNYTDVFQNLTINFMRGISTKKGIELIDSMLDE
jgi:AcrR family transcriptional regulator